MQQSPEPTAPVKQQQPIEIGLQPDPQPQIPLPMPVPQHARATNTDKSSPSQSFTQKLKVPEPLGFETVPKDIKLQQFATDLMTFQGDNLIDGKITIHITGSVQKGSTLSKYTAYMIVGQDSKGRFEVYRRYSEFDALRMLMKQRWPGCYIPVLPEKTMTKNSTHVVQQRQRMLDYFVKAVASSKHLYFSEQFQMFVRSGESDVSSAYEKMMKVSLEEIVNRYKDVFADLGGKEVDSEASVKISSFRTSLKKVQQQLGQLQQATVAMATSKDIINEKMPTLYNIITRYERNTVVEFSQGRQQKLVYFKDTNIEQFQKHQSIISSATKHNPFWLLSDLIKTDLKDCQAFLQVIQTIDLINQKKLQTDAQIRQYEQDIEELTLGRSTVKSMTTRKSKEEVKKITEDKKKETISKKHLYMALGDMVQVLIGYLEIDNFKKLKKRYYKSILKKISGSEAYVMLSLTKIWGDIEKATRPSEGQKPFQKKPSIGDNPTKPTSDTIITTMEIPK